MAAGIVQEFQFGMSWSEYARFVGDIFGAPLAVEALLAFSLNPHSWDYGYSAGENYHQKSTRCIWMVAAGIKHVCTMDYRNNSWMQSVGAVFNPITGRAELDGALGFFAVVLDM